MTLLKGKPIFGGLASGPALVTKMPINFTASFTKPKNLFPWGRSQIQDRHHDLFKRNVKGCVLIFPAAIGLTYTGMVLLELMYQERAPAAVVVQKIDPLLVSVLSLRIFGLEKAFQLLSIQKMTFTIRYRTVGG